jgi:hypothetical protein
VRAARRGGKTADEVAKSQLGANTAFALGIAQQETNTGFGSRRVASALQPIHLISGQ